VYQIYEHLSYSLGGFFDPIRRDIVRSRMAIEGRPDEFSKSFMTGKLGMFQSQTDQLIEPYFSKPLEQQDVKQKILIETDRELGIIN
jgi:hypothetical protein